MGERGCDVTQEDMLGYEQSEDRHSDSGAPDVVAIANNANQLLPRELALLALAATSGAPLSLS